MKHGLVLSAVVTVALASCSTPMDAAVYAAKGDGGAPGAGGAGGDGGSGASTIACEAPRVVRTLVGAPLSSMRECLETEQPEALEMCENIEEDLGDFSPQCFRRGADGARFWFSSPYPLQPLSTDWELCDEQVIWHMLPPPCFTECGEQTLDKPPQATISMCSMSSTREWFGCGNADSSWDDNCCRRKNCSTNADCAADEQCITINDPVTAFIHCWNNGPELESCACGGSFNGAPEAFCFPK